MNRETAKFSGWFCSFHIKIWDGGKIITSLHFKEFQAGLKHYDGLAELETPGLQLWKHRLHCWMLLRNGELPKATQKEVFLSLRCSCTLCDTPQCLFMCLPVYLLACIQCSGCHGESYTNFVNMPSLTCAYSPLCLLPMWGPRELTLLSGNLPVEQRKSPPVRAFVLQRWP